MSTNTSPKSSKLTTSAGLKLTATKRRTLKKAVDQVLGQLTELKLKVDAGVKEVNPDLKKLSSKIDSMSEMGEMESLRLQMAMDRMNKMMSMLSNILKKMNETQEGIVGNMK